MAGINVHIDKYCSYTGLLVHYAILLRCFTSGAHPCQTLQLQLNNMIDAKNRR